MRRAAFLHGKRPKEAAVNCKWLSTELLEVALALFWRWTGLGVIEYDLLEKVERAREGKEGRL